MYMSVNAARVDEGEPVSEGAVAAIRARNLLDLELYDFARELFEGAIAAHGASFRRELVVFRALNRIPDTLGPRTPARLRRVVRRLPR